MQLLKFRLQSSGVENVVMKRAKDTPDAKSRAVKLLLAITAVQATFFLFVVSDPEALLLTTIALCALWLLIIACMPRSVQGASVGGSGLLHLGRWLPAMILALAAFKIATRSDMYFASLIEGFSFARQLIDDRVASESSFQTVVNVFLTPLWINLVVARGGNRSALNGLDWAALTSVPLISLLDMFLFGGRVIFAFQMVVLFIAGILRPRVALWVGIFFVGAFTYVHASRSPELLELGFSYLSLTASGGSLPPLRDLAAMGVPPWTVGPLVLAQYIAHPVGEIMYLISELPSWQPTFATLGDQFAAIGLGDRAASQDWLEQANPRFGTYQTFFGPLLVDFGLVGFGIAIAGLLTLAGLSHFLGGHLRQVVVLLILSNLALASIDNFFIMGGGFTQSILAVFLAFAFSNRARGVARV